MKKFLLSIILISSFGVINESRAQCSGANISVNSFVYLPGPGIINYNYDWTHTQGNASIEVVFLCNNIQVASLPCIQRLNDFPTGIPQNVTGSISVPNTCVGTMRMLVKVWSNNTCGGTSCNDNFRDVTNIPLPVAFTKFSASRENTSVNLVWQTASEQNSKGFTIERNNGNGIWLQVGYVATKAVGGNSNEALSYNYTDNNNAKSITQYRLRQIDNDDATKLSDIRSIRGLTQKGGIILYPNPSNDGKVNIVFEDKNVTRDVAITDMGGRVVKQINTITANSITIDNLVSGMYTIRVSVPATGEQIIEKIIVNKH
jgi:hypothetical protein